MKSLAGSTPEAALCALRAAAPRFAAVRLEPVGASTANFVYRTDEGEIVRFPHSVWVRDGFFRERRLLDLLDGRLSVAIPKIRHFNEDPVFMTYAAIEGVVASRDKVQGFDASRRARLGSSLGNLLAELHAEPVSRYDFLPRDYGPDLIGQLRARGRQIAARDPTGRVGPILEAALAAWDARDANGDEQVLLHQDLHGQNLVCDPETGDLAGVLDFTLAWIGSPVWDFPEIFRCGADILEHAIAIYHDRCGRRIDVETVRTLSRLQLCRSLDHARPGSPREVQVLKRIHDHP